MSITTYDELKTAVENWLDRHDTDTIARIPEFISLVDARLNRKQLTRDTKLLIYDDAPQTGELFFNSFFPPDASPTSPIPLTQSMTNLRSLTLIGVQDDDNPALFNPPLDAPVVDLVSPELLYAARSFNPTARAPRQAAVLADRIIVSPLPDSVYRWQIEVEVAEPLSDTNPSNSVLAIAPDVYLYGALVEAAPYFKDDERFPLFEQRFASALQELDNARNLREWPNTPIMRQPRVFT